MPATGPTFTDWVQLEADRQRPLLVDEDFSWSEVPSRRRRSHGSVAVAQRRGWAEPELADQPDGDGRDWHEDGYEAEPAYQSPAYQSPADQSPADQEPVEPINLEHELDAAWGGRLSAPPAAETYEVAPYEFEHDAVRDTGARRTVVITGRGAERYAVLPRRRRDAELSFHERSGFSPDRTAMWAVLLGIALLLGCIAH